jgi:outer membrane protein assembly factor BamB
MADSTAPPARTWRRFIFPVVAVPLLVVLFLLPDVWVRADLDPAPLLNLSMICFMLSILLAVLLLIWFLFFSGLRRVTKLATLAVLVLAGGGFAACVEKWEFDASLRPIPTMKWGKTVEPATPAPVDSSASVDLSEVPGRDFPRYRGFHGDGSVTGVALATDWASRPPKELWRRPSKGGYAGAAVAGNVVVTLEQRGDQEAIVCYDRATGGERWGHAYPARFTHSETMGGDGPRSTPTISRGLVYAVGATGWLTCVDGRTGAKVWAVNILEDNQSKNVEWGLTGSPLVVGDRVIVNPGVDPKNNAGKGLAAYHRLTGAKLWAAGGHQAGYSSPQLARLGGVEQALIFDAGGLAGHDLESGKELWRFPFKSEMDMAIVQPVVLGDDRVYISSQPSAGGAMVRVTRQGDGWKAEPVWANRQLYAQFANPVLADGHIFGLTAGFLVCLDVETGQRRWRERGAKGDFGAGQVLRAGDVLLLFTERGEVVLAAADPKQYREFARFRVLEHKKTWNTPTLAGNQLLVRNHLEMVCYELPTR